MLIDILVIAVVLAIVGAAAGYVRKEKKRGIKCIGCPDGHKCQGGCSGCSGNCH